MNHILMKVHSNEVPIVFERGEGVWLWDKEGNKYLDALSGYGVSALGHSHPFIINAIQQQIKKLIHTSDFCRIEEAEKLAEKLIQLSNMKQVAFVNSGAEANEVAIKLTRLYAKKNNILNPLIITMDQAFHGHTFAAMSATGITERRAGFEPFLADFVAMPFNDLHILQKFVKANKNTIAIMLEPIQGDGGIHIADATYLQGIRALCDEHDLLMIVDEVQCGLGRSGKWFAFQYADCKPDIITLAKALANGIPMGACLSSERAANLFKRHQHGSTFGGNQLSCVTALAVLKTIEDKNILAQVQQRGYQLLESLKKDLSSNPQVLDVRGRGLMIGIELDRNCKDIVQLGLKHRILLNVVNNRIIRLLPPFIISPDETNQLIERLTTCIAEFLDTRIRL